jgi:hypothetical protein
MDLVFWEPFHQVPYRKLFKSVRSKLTPAERTVSLFTKMVLRKPLNLSAIDSHRTK